MWRSAVQSKYDFHPVCMRVNTGCMSLATGVKGRFLHGSLSRKMWAMLAFSLHWMPLAGDELVNPTFCCQFLRWPQTTVSLTHCCQTVPPHSQECRTWIKHFWLLCDGCVCEQFTVLHVFPFFFLPMFVFNLKRRLYWPEPVTITISALSRNKSSGMFCFPKILLLWNQHVAGWFLVFPAHIWLLSRSLCSRSPARQHPNRQLRSLLESLHSSRY